MINCICYDSVSWKILITVTYTRQINRKKHCEDAFYTCFLTFFCDKRTTTCYVSCGWLYLYVKYTLSTTSVCPLVRIGTLPPPLSPASVTLPPEPGGGAHSPAGEGLGESQFRRLEKKLSTGTYCLIWGRPSPVGWACRERPSRCRPSPCSGCRSPCLALYTDKKTTIEIAFLVKS